MIWLEEGANSESNNHEVREIAPAVLNSQNVSRDDFPHCSMREVFFSLTIMVNILNINEIGILKVLGSGSQYSPLAPNTRVAHVHGSSVCTSMTTFFKTLLGALNFYRVWLCIYVCKCIRDLWLNFLILDWKFTHSTVYTSPENSFVPLHSRTWSMKMAKEKRYY